MCPRVCVRVCVCVAVYSSDVFSPQARVTRLQCGHTLTVCRCLVFSSLPWMLSSALSCLRLALNRCKPHHGLILSDLRVQSDVSCEKYKWRTPASPPTNTHFQRPLQRLFAEIQKKPQNSSSSIAQMGEKKKNLDLLRANVLWNTSANVQVHYRIIWKFQTSVPFNTAPQQHQASSVNCQKNGSQLVCFFSFASNQAYRHTRRNLASR